METTWKNYVDYALTHEKLLWFLSYTQYIEMMTVMFIVSRKTNIGLIVHGRYMKV